ncbi:GLE1-domain-containing protein [Tothia fuscella]|uniref:mRNA export factor GLE1 n=1 Tax=Tothia fuscella TaxID=1048955 RepID=A0A9P4NT11_9PEZI|nr:GLE1-domain-containing protein [Tothia fuscella]
MAKPESPRRTSEEFIEEFGRMLINRDREFRASLTRSSEEQQQKYNTKLAEALEHHKKVREAAEYILEQEQKLLRDQIEEADRLAKKKIDDEVKKQQDEQRQRRLEEQEQEAKRQEKLRELEAREKRLQDEEKARVARLDQERKTKEAALEQERRTKAESAAAAAAAATQRANAAITSAKPAILPQAVPTPASTAVVKPPPSTATASTVSTTTAVAEPASPITTSMAQRNATHKQYLELHQRLKEHRANMKKLIQEAPEGSPLKKLSDTRRDLVKSFGQFTNSENGTPEGDKVAKSKNNEKARAILAKVIEARGAAGPPIDARQFIINPTKDRSLLSEAEAQVSSGYIFLLNACAKAALKTMRESSSANYNAAEPIGISLAMVFGDRGTHFNTSGDQCEGGEPFIDILLAKLHKGCPILFGIYGPETTNLGRDRLGWPRDEDGPSGYINPQTFYDEMSGYATGWAALTLRDFRRSQRAINSCPPWHYWRTIACLVNTSPKDTTPTHFVVLKGLLQHYATKFIAHYGQAATVAMRKAILELPKTHAGDSAAKGNMAQGLALLGETLKKKDIYL